MTDETASKLTPAGWPRPIVNGWPVPWVSPSHDLAKMSPRRTTRLLNKYICQVYGSGHKRNDRVFFCVNAIDRQGNRHDPIKEKEIIICAMDHGILHERCLKLALGRCPKLKEIIAAKSLFTFSAPRYRAILIPSTVYDKTFGFAVLHCKFEEQYSSYK